MSLALEILEKLLLNFDGCAVHIMSLALEGHILYHGLKCGALRNLFLASPQVSAALVGYPAVTTEFSFYQLYFVTMHPLNTYPKVFRRRWGNRQERVVLGSWRDLSIWNVPLDIVPDCFDSFMVSMVF